MNNQILENKYSKYFLNFFILLSSLTASLPSLLIYVTSTLTNDSTGFIRNSILFNEKFWIYLLEFKRNSIKGFQFWPSENIDFANIIYIERLFPRSIYYPIRNNTELYFLYDAIVIFVIMILCQIIITRIFSNEESKKISVPIVLGIISIYNLKVLFLEKGIFESWFSRNPVAIISLTLFVTIYLSDKFLLSRKRYFFYAFIFLLFAITHTYSYLLATTFYFFRNISNIFIDKKLYFQKFLIPIPSLLLFLIYYKTLNSSASFSIFRDYLGLVNSYIPNINEIIKIVFLFIITFSFVPKSAKFNFFILIISSLALTNTHIFTGQALRDIHYRLYSVEWLCSFYIVSNIINYLSSRANKFFIYYIFIGIFIMYNLIYIKEFKYFNLVIDPNRKCNLSTPMTGALLDMNKQEALNCDIFIWDSPSVENSKNLINECINSDLECKNWFEAIAHLHPKL